jgi:SNF2 family DNA or RNA helicase
MKKSKGRLSLAVKKIPSRSCFALTGTLIQNRMDEMWSVLDFVSPCPCLYS